MLDYMCGLQAKFFHVPSFPDLEQEIATLHDELVQKMDRADRRKLLELGDLTDELSSRITLASFTAGFKLAAGIAAELGNDSAYSFDEDEEKRAIRSMQNEEN